MHHAYNKSARNSLNGSVPGHFFQSFKLFLHYTNDTSLDPYKQSFQQLLFPVFVNMFLQMHRKGFKQEAHDFLESFGGIFSSFDKQNDLAILRMVRDKHQVDDPHIARFHNPFFVKIQKQAMMAL